jgi:hypothetical protein
MTTGASTMHRISPLLFLTLLLACLSTPAAEAPRGSTPDGQGKGDIEGDLDAFMANVMLKRRINWDHLHGYVFNEMESLEIKGVKLPPMANFRREYVWLVRDGYLVRSPVRVNGVKVSKKEQADAEEQWLRGKKDKRHETLGRDTFFHFRFEPGSYLYAGTQMFEGRELVAIEYYPKKRRREDQDPGNKKEDDYERMFKKTILVTMLIEPKEYQIVRITFDNVGLEFLPFRWLVRLEEIRASMTMHKPLGDVWLPRRIMAAGSIDTAGPSLSVKYTREFYDYSKTDVKVKLRFEGFEPPEQKP